MSLQLVPVWEDEHLEITSYIAGKIVLAVILFRLMGFIFSMKFWRVLRCFIKAKREQKKALRLQPKQKELCI